MSLKTLLYSMMLGLACSLTAQSQSAPINLSTLLPEPRIILSATEVRVCNETLFHFVAETTNGEREHLFYPGYVTKATIKPLDETLLPMIWEACAKLREYPSSIKPLMRELRTCFILVTNELGIIAFELTSDGTRILLYNVETVCGVNGIFQRMTPPITRPEVCIESPQLWARLNVLAKEALEKGSGVKQSDKNGAPASR